MKTGKAQGPTSANATERSLLSIWSALLPVPPDSVNDGFFALGGNSLTACQMLARVHAQFGVFVSSCRFQVLPTVAALGREVDRLCTAAARVKDQLSTDPMATDRQGAPLSFSQQRYWFLYQLDPTSPAYNTALAFRLRGPLNLDALQWSLDQLVARHGSLRTRFSLVDGDPTQWVEPVATVPMRRLELSKDLARHLQDPCQAALAAEISEPFRLETGPPFRVALARPDEQNWLLVVTLHHIVSDRWTQWILTRELAECYRSAVNRHVPKLPEMPIQYTEYALNLRERVSGHYREQLLSYWRTQLAPPLPILDLAPDWPRPKRLSGHGAVVRFTLGQDLTARLRTLGRKTGVTLYVTSLALFKLLLFRYGGNPDSVVGTTTANRLRVEEEGVVGSFANTLVMRSDASGDPSLRGYLERVRNTVLDAIDHQEAPFELLVEELQPARDVGRNPLFQAMFNFANTPWESLQLPGIEVENLDAHSGAAMFDLTLSLVETDGALHGHLEYSTDLFLPETARRMTHHYRMLAESAVAHPELPISELSLIDESELAQLLTWATRTPPRTAPAEALLPIHEQVERRARERPDAIALTLGNTCLSYRDLIRRADAIAYRLMSMGVTAETLVGVCAPRSIEMITGLLGILKSGAAYLPLDPDHPAARLELMIRDSQTKVLLTQGRGAEKLAGCDCATLPLDEIDWTASPEWGKSDRSDTTPEALAYVIYTSGTTGTPKGVAVEHRQVAHLLRSTSECFDLRGSDVWTLYHSSAFDFSVWELWGALTTGARLVIVPQADTRNPQRFVDLLRAQGVTILSQTPSALSLLVSFLEKHPEQVGALDPLRYLILGGERLSSRVLGRWFDCGPTSRCTVVNMYGITETTVHATCRTIRADEPRHGPSAPIGQPLPHLSIHLLDTSGQRVPIGVPGEIFIGGKGLARGYLAQPHLTAERFVPDRFASSPDARLYRTGDRARFTDNGDLEYLGRIDNQVKIRGYRIELGEIEAVLARDSRISHCAVIDARDDSGLEYLLGYFVADQTLDVAPILSSLRRQLPDYMIPAALFQLNKIPLNPNGKLDRSALPAPIVRQTSMQSAQLTKLETQIAKVWLEILGQGRNIEPDSDFFEIGGHSLGAIRLAWGLGEVFEFEVPFITIFEATTVRQQAAWIENRLSSTVAG